MADLLLSNTILRGPLPKSIRPTNAAPVAAAGWTVSERGINQLHQSVFTCTQDLAVTLTDEAGQGQSGYKKVCTLPEGVVLVSAAMVEGTLELLAPFIDAANVEASLATAAVAGGAAMASGEKDILAVAAAVAVTKVRTFSANGGAPNTVHDGRATPVDVYLNFRVADDALHATTAGNKLNATVVLVWMPLANE